MKGIEECRTEYFKWFPLLQELYTFSNPIVIKAALNLLGLPGGHLRKPYEDYSGEKLEHLKHTLIETGVMEKYHITSCAYIGDTQGDYEATVEAGVPFLWASYGFGTPAGYAGKIDSFEDLLKL